MGVFLQFLTFNGIKELKLTHELVCHLWLVEEIHLFEFALGNGKSTFLHLLKDLSYLLDGVEAALSMLILYWLLCLSHLSILEVAHIISPLFIHLIDLLVRLILPSSTCNSTYREGGERERSTSRPWQLGRRWRLLTIKISMKIVV